MKVIEVQHLQKFYGKSRGIVDVDFHVEKGEIFGFIGPNGAGKSTTIRILLSLIAPTGGRATIFGKDCQKEGAEIRKEVGYLPSEVFYYDNMRAIDLLNYSASFYGKDCSKRIHELADVMQLDLHKKIDDMSYGNRKKVGIVQGLLHSPKLIILDEPTGGLDPLMQQKFFNLLKEENERGATILFSSHILSEVQRLCDRVAIVKEGRIIKIETMKSLRDDMYKKVRLETDGKVDASDFALKGMNGLTITGNQVNFMYKGDINLLLKTLTAMKLRNVWISEPELEEIFMHYYQES